jgi:hypothetical protein
MRKLVLEISLNEKVLENALRGNEYVDMAKKNY